MFSGLEPSNVLFRQNCSDEILYLLDENSKHFRNPVIELREFRWSQEKVSRISNDRNGKTEVINGQDFSRFQGSTYCRLSRSPTMMAITRANAMLAYNIQFMMLDCSLTRSKILFPNLSSAASNFFMGFTAF